MSKIHFVLQGKGGVGKSLVASLISQYFKSRETPLVCIDTDPVNDTLANYKALPVRRIELMDNGKINESEFDSMMEIMLDNPGHPEIVVDNGASAFIPLSSYLIENHALEILAEHGHVVTVHTIITGGQTLFDTINGLDALITQFPEGVKFVVWLNEYFGEIEQDGKTFQEMKVYQIHEERIHKIITIQKRGELFERDMQKMLKARLTFDETRRSTAFQLMSKSRLFRIKEALFTQMEGL